jgi:hypothetical protein
VVLIEEHRPAVAAVGRIDMEVETDASLAIGRDDFAHTGDVIDCPLLGGADHADQGEDRNLLLD